MSAIRSWNVFNRRERRNSSAKPYSHDRGSGPRQSLAQRKDESWSITGIFSFIAGLGRASQSRRDVEEGINEDAQQRNDVNEGMATTAMPSLEGGIMQTPAPTEKQPIASGSGLPPMTPSNMPMDSSDDSILEWVKYKQESQIPVNRMEFIGFKSLIDKRKEKTYDPEPFHFSSTPSTPSRSPVNGLRSPSPAPSPSKRGTFSGSSSLPPLTNNKSSSKTSRRMLSKDPNGPIHWRGAGSARASPSRSRRGSPARQSTQSSPKADNSKRRRVYEEGDNLDTQSGAFTSQPAPASRADSTGSGSSIPSKLSAIHKLPRASIIRPPTTPANPSPLRQVINGASSPGSPGSPPSHTRTSPTSAHGMQTRTRAASVLTEMIEKVTPPPKPDIANPYQTASPVKPMTKPKETRRMSERRAKAAEVGKEREKKQETKELSAKTIIEATVPKGAKRSRPPPGLGKSRSDNIEAHENDTAPTVEEPEEESTPKKKFRSVTIEDVEDDEDMTGGTSYARPSEIIEPVEPSHEPVRPSTSAPSNIFTPPLNTKTTTFGGPRSSLPKEPSKLRSSFIAEDDGEISKPNTPVPSSAPNKTVADGLSYLAQKSKEPKDIAMEMDKCRLPVFVFRMTYPPFGLEYSDARAKALELPVSSLPTYSFSKSSMNGFPKVASVASSEGSGKAPLPPVAPAVKAFDWSAAGLAPKMKAAGDTWTCGTCMLSNPASATDKCSICDTPR